MTEETPAIPTEDEKAFADARAGFSVGDIELYPHSTQRRFAADRMGLMWGTVPFDDPLRKAGRYAGALRDVTIVLWLGTIPRKAETSIEQRARGIWTVERADRTPEDAYEAAQTWAETIGLTDTDAEAWKPCWQTFLKIKTGEAVSKFRVTTDHGGRQEEIEPGNLSSQPPGPISSPE